MTKERCFIAKYSVVRGYYIFQNPMVGKFLLCKQESGNYPLHKLYTVLIVRGDKGSSGFDRTEAFLKYFNNAISHVLPTLIGWHQ